MAETNTSPIQFAQGEVESKTRQGIHKTRYNITKGWGEVVNGWGIEFNSDLAARKIHLDLAFDENSDEFKRILRNAYSFDQKNIRGYLQRTMRFAGRNEGTRPYTTESIISSVLLRQIIEPDEGVLTQPEVVIPMAVIGSNHSPSLSAVRFMDAKAHLESLVHA